MIVLIDADSLIWSSCYKQKESTEDTGYHNIEEAKDKYNEVVMKIINTIEVDHEVISIDCEPYDIFFTERMLTHDSSTVD